MTRTRTTDPFFTITLQFLHPGVLRTTQFTQNLVLRMGVRGGPVRSVRGGTRKKTKGGTKDSAVNRRERTRGTEGAAWHMAPRHDDTKTSELTDKKAQRTDVSVDGCVGV